MTITEILINVEGSDYPMVLQRNGEKIHLTDTFHLDNEDMFIEITEEAAVELVEAIRKMKEMK